MDSKGNASFVVLVILVVFSVFLLGAALFAQSVSRYFVVDRELDDAMVSLQKEAEYVVSLLLDDPTPEADSPFDPVWEQIKTPELPGAEIELEELSSRINPNQADKYLIDASGLLSPATNYQQFHDFRTEEGPFMNIASAYSDYFSKEDLLDYFSGYGFFNINTTNQTMVRNVIAARTGENAEDNPAFKRFLGMRKKAAIIKPEQLKQVFTDQFNLLFPVLNTEPLYNANFLHKNTLSAVVKVAKVNYKIKLNVNAIVNSIVSNREDRELTQSDLKAIIKPKFKNTILENFLGTATWFWRIRVSKEKRSLVWIVARVPENPDEKEEDKNGRQFKLLEEVFDG